MSDPVNEDELTAVLELDERESIRYRLAVEVQQHRAAIARVKALVADLRKSNSGSIWLCVADEIEAVLRGERSGR